MRLASTTARLGLLMLLALITPALAQDWSGRGRVNGTVSDESGKPIAGASITLRRADAPEEGPPVLKSDKKGRWSYLGLLGGPWNVKIEAEGFIPSEGSINVNEFQPNPMVQIQLRPLSSIKPKVDPKLAEAQAAIDRGDALLRDKKAAEARAEYEKALPSFEGANRTIILKRIATCQMVEGDDEGAVESLKKALVDSPDDPDTLRLLVDRLIVLHRDAEAQEYMAKLPQGTGIDPNTILNMGINLYNENKLEEALAKFEEVVAAKPDWPDGFYYRGLAKLATGKTAEAKGDFEKVLALDPNSRYASDAREFLKSL